MNLDDKAIKATTARLKELPKKSKGGQTLREVIYLFRADINRALAKGYSFAEVADILKEQNISIAPSTLKQYVSEFKAKSVKGTKEVKDEAKLKSSQKRLAETGKLSKDKDVSDQFNNY